LKSASGKSDVAIVNWVNGEETCRQYWIEQNINRCSGETAARIVREKPDAFTCFIFRSGQKSVNKLEGVITVIYMKCVNNVRYGKFT